MKKSLKELTLKKEVISVLNQKEVQGGRRGGTSLDGNRTCNDDDNMQFLCAY